MTASLDSILDLVRKGKKLENHHVLLLVTNVQNMRRALAKLSSQNAVYEDALREIKNTGSRHVWASSEKEDGSYEKKVVKIDMSIEAMMAHDALIKGEQ